MKIYLSLIIVLMQLNLNAFVDLGIHAQAHAIEEDSLMSVLENRAEKVDKSEMVRNLKSNFEESITVHSSLRNCESTNRREFIPLITLNEDLIEPYSQKMIAKKGTQINVLEKYKYALDRYILIINADDDIQVSLALKYQNNALIYVAKGNPTYLLNEGIDVKNIQNKSMADILSLRCLPSFYTPNEDKFLIDEINTEELVVQ